MHLSDRKISLSPLNAKADVVNRTIAWHGPIRKKVCIYGAGLGRREAPLDDPSWYVYALNLVPPFDRNNCLRADVWFDLHQRKAQTADDLRWIAACPVPIYVPPDLEDASPMTVRYPLAEIEAAFGAYWACTFAYQIALVLYEGIATDLGLYGVELAYGTRRERTMEWANTAYWLGRAEERGLTIHLPEHSLLGRHRYRYGFEYAEEIADVRDYTEMMRDVEQERDVAGSESDDDVAVSRG